jgi:C1A family cysteine protease
MTHAMGWRPQLNDQRDYRLALPMAKPLPIWWNLRPYCPAVYDQGQLGSCTANAIAGLIEFDMIKQRLPSFTPSRLFIYYNERVMEGTTASDAGAIIRDGLKSVGTQGACPETDWPYDVNAFATQPPTRCYTDAKLDRAVSYYYVQQTLIAMQVCLAAGYPFVFGFTAYQELESDAVAATGILPMPKPRAAPIGGHAVMAVGYNDKQQRFYCRNSWGAGWGQGGYFTMPYNYLLSPNLAADFWTIRTVG